MIASFPSEDAFLQHYALAPIDGPAMRTPEVMAIQPRYGFGVTRYMLQARLANGDKYTSQLHADVASAYAAWKAIFSRT